MDILGTLRDLALESGFATFFTTAGGWKNLIMILIAFVLLYLGIVKKFEPLLLCGIAFGCLLSNLSYFVGMGDNALYHPELWEAFLDEASPYYHSYGHIMSNAGLLDFFYIGVKAGIYPSLIFLGVGAMTDFGPLLANPKSLLLGAAAQLGVFIAFFGAVLLGFTGPEAASIGIIGGADGPTAIYLTTKLAPQLLGPIAIAAYSYMALVPIIQPFAIRLVTTRKERRIHMEYNPKSVNKQLRIAFPIAVTIIVGLISPQSVALVGFLMFGNLLRECGVLGSLRQTAQNEFANIITLLLGITISFSMRAEQFVNPATLMIMVLGLVAFVFDTVGGVLFAKLINVFLKMAGKKPVNPMIGGCGISAFPMSSRVVQKMAAREEPGNIILMQAAGTNVSGQVASVIAGGLVISIVSQYL